VRPCLNNRKKEGRKERRKGRKEGRKEGRRKERKFRLSELDIQGFRINTLTVAKWICFQST
jgi:hypothetical protein